MRLFVFGLGYVGEAFASALRARGWAISATARDAEQAESLRIRGIVPADPGDRDAMAAALAGVNAILVTAPPGPDGCPALESLIPALAHFLLKRQRAPSAENSAAFFGALRAKP